MFPKRESMMLLVECYIGEKNREQFPFVQAITRFIVPNLLCLMLRFIQQILGISIDLIEIDDIFARPGKSITCRRCHALAMIQEYADLFREITDFLF